MPASTIAPAATSQRTDIPRPPWFAVVAALLAVAGLMYWVAADAQPRHRSASRDREQSRRRSACVERRQCARTARPQRARPLHHRARARPDERSSSARHRPDCRSLRRSGGRRHHPRAGCRGNRRARQCPACAPRASPTAGAAGATRRRAGDLCRKGVGAGGGNSKGRTERRRPHPRRLRCSRKSRRKLAPWPKRQQR